MAVIWLDEGWKPRKQQPSFLATVKVVPLPPKKLRTVTQSEFRGHHT